MKKRRLRSWRGWAVVPHGRAPKSALAFTKSYSGAICVLMGFLELHCVPRHKKTHRCLSWETVPVDIREVPKKRLPPERKT